MYLACDTFNQGFGPATPSTAAVPSNYSTNYGGPRIHETETTQFWPFGFRIRGYDNLLGYGEFLYLQGVASTVVGNLVNYDPFTGLTTRNVPAAFNAVPFAVAMAPTVANLFGWYQVSGTMTVLNNATAAAGSAFQVGTGTISSTSTVSQQILGGARILTANGSTFTKVCTTRNGSTELIVPNLDAVFVGCPISGTGIAGGATVAAGYNNSPNGRNSSAGSASTLIMSAAATADGTVTVTFTRTNYSLLSGNNIFGQGIIT